MVLWIGKCPKSFIVLELSYFGQHCLQSSHQLELGNLFGMKRFPVPKNLTCLSVLEEIPGMSFLLFALPHHFVSVRFLFSQVTVPTVPFLLVTPLELLSSHKLCTTFYFFFYQLHHLSFPWISLCAFYVWWLRTSILSSLSIPHLYKTSNRLGMLSGSLRDPHGELWQVERFDL